MDYWHLRIHPENQILEKWVVEFNEKKLLSEYSLIGMGLPKESSLLKSFIYEMQIDDIVLIRHHQEAIALVKIVGGVEDRQKNDYSKLDWFRYARRVQVLGYASKESNHFPNSSKITLKRHKKDSLAYEFIESWYHQIERENDIYHFHKLEEVQIENHPILGDLKLNLKDKSGSPLPLVVIGGENGAGKSTLLREMLEYKANRERNYIKVSKRSEHDNYISLSMCKEEQDTTGTIREYQESLLFLPSGIDDTSKSETDLIKFYEELATEYESKDEAFRYISELFSKLFKDLSLGFTIEKIDADAKVLFLRKEGSGAILKMRDLSLGEQNLFSKIFLLFLTKKRDQTILIDNPELTFHSSWKSKIVEIYQELAQHIRSQIIMTTSSQSVMDSVERELLTILKKR